MISPIPLTTLLLLLPSFALAGTAHRKRRSCHRRSSTASLAAATTEASSPSATQTLPVASEAAAPASTQVSAIVVDDSSLVASGAGQWTLKETMIGHNFLDSFNFETFDDPTHGTVDYVGAEEAASMNLTYSTDSTFTLRADSFSVVPASSRGRKSVRLASKNSYTAGVTIITLSHMPTGCGTWPAFWTVGSNWPNNGEIDIIEGVNNDGDNLSSLHSSSGCNMPSSGRVMQAAATGLKCGSSDGDNSGCGTTNNAQENSFGAGFNNANGGTYAMRRDSEAIKVWFWPAGTEPKDVSGSKVIDESTWGTPTAVFPSSDQCDLDAHFAAHQIVLNLTFCGDWAGSSYGSDSSCPSSCDDHVRNSPSSFNEAYFEVQSIRTYA
ncbi:concanavalin A-like lectin/glucanase domain-containing protein [Mrakia frigida]|uniref:glycoside hydrolase family 16 protein n=1 Tax=Mrakia frigida TaxID=29902 RepID=UPI003FCC0125